MKIPESAVFMTYMIFNTNAITSCKNENGIERCCKDYRMENGTCVVCPAGTHGIDCAFSCPQGYYGVKCQAECQCDPAFECSPKFGCRKPGCGSIPVKENTEVSFTSSSYGSKARYKCVEGFNQSGIDGIKCLNNGTWERPTVHCDPKEPDKNEKYSIVSDCGPPPNISFALTDVDGTIYGSVARFSCFDNYLGEGIENVTCTAEGLWDNSSFVCSNIEEPAKNEPAKNEPAENVPTVSGTKQRTHSSGILVYLVAGVTVFFIVVIIIVAVLFHISFRIFTERNKLELKFQNSIEMQIYSETDDQQV